ARENARAVRTALTAETWDSINSAWLELQKMKSGEMTRDEFVGFLDWVKSVSLAVDGSAYRTMLRNDAFWFTRLGLAIERADNTARILDVKYHVLLPSHEGVGGVLDYYQWQSILRAVSALRSYQWVYHDRLKPWLIAELLILRPEMPRSLVACSGQVMECLDDLARLYGGRHGECHRLAGEMHARLKYGRIESIFQFGLHEFLSEYIETSTVIGREIGTLYLSS
ncbi:MAG TPA: alpha-E domain-containing protein, partial [Azospirillaceae bacterium]|nr:alpha-E domain-containing protein [Azospirillaceae bacterium]